MNTNILRFGNEKKKKQKVKFCKKNLQKIAEWKILY